MEVRLLGPLEIIDAQGALLPVPGARLRALAALLAMEVGQVVATERLVDSLWGDAAPRGATNSLQGLVSRLRKALGGPERVAMRATGYVLDIEPDRVDVVCFERLAAEGREAMARGELERAVALLLDADRLWRGSALADFVYEDFAQPAIARLSELRLASIEERLGAQLALGMAASVATDLEALVAAHPLRERLRGYLMVALYQSGRQAEALRAYQEGRRILGEELGLDAGAELQRLEAAILAHDPALDSSVPAPLAPKPASQRRPTNLRVPLTSLIGRAAELHDLIGLLDEQRLLTIVGPGGAGKSRVALELALQVAEQFDDGAWFVELAAIESPGAIGIAISQALAVPDAPGAEPEPPVAVPGLRRVVEFLAEKRLLLVLDNCEHLADGAARAAAELLGSCPAITLLVTSREALRLPGETVWPLPPLQLDDAMTLFSERAKSADASLSVSADSESVVAEICSRLDGLPLAIELAAARTRAFPLSQISARLDDRFRLLTGGARTALPRQQTLRAVVDWSYDLLFEDERSVFERLSVFPGGCSLDAAEAVCAQGPLEPADISDLIGTLVDKSLVVADHRAPEPRYRLLQTLSHYGRDRLSEHGGTVDARERMTAYFAECCLRSEPAFRGTGQVAWFTTVREELDNLRAAHECAIQSGDAERALLVAGALGWYWWLAGGASEGCRWLDAALACTGDAQPGTLATALMWRAYLGFLSGDPDRSDAHSDEALAIFGDRHDDLGLGTCQFLTASHMLAGGEVARALGLLRAAGDSFDRAPEDEAWVFGARAYVRALIAEVTGDEPASEAKLLEAIGHHRIAGDLWGTAAALMLLASQSERRGEYREARRFLEDALEQTRELSLPGVEATLLCMLGNVATLDGELDASERLHEEALELGRRMAYPPVVARALSGSAERLRRQGRLEEAERAALQALDMYRSPSARTGTGESSRYAVPGGAAISLIALGRVASERGDISGSVRLHEEALVESRLAADRRTIALALEALAGALANQGDAERAARLLGEASNIASVRGPVETLELERTEAEIVSALGRAAFTAAFEEGRGL